jgi:hypothetical protein
VVLANLFVLLFKDTCHHHKHPPRQFAVARGQAPLLVPCPFLPLVIGLYLRCTDTRLRPCTTRCRDALDGYSLRRQSLFDAVRSRSALSNSALGWLALAQRIFPALIQLQGKRNSLKDSYGISFES